MLFPTTRDIRSARPPTERVPATSSTHPNPRLGSASQGYPEHYHRRNSTQPLQLQTSVSPYQNPRVRNSIHGTGPSTLSQRFSPNGQHLLQHNFYASSAPSSSTALPSKRSHPQRPPVPIFPSNSTGNISEDNHTMVFDSSPDGTDSSLIDPDSCGRLTSIITGMAGIDYDFSLGEYVSDFSPLEDSTTSPVIDFSTSSFRPINDPALTHIPVDSHTVSPQDLWLENPSAPPSSALTFLSTPQYSDMDASPDYSNETSPLFPQDNAVGDFDFIGSDFNEATDMMIPPLEELQNDSSVIEPQMANSITTMGAHSMSRNQSSPGHSSSRGSITGRHSSTAGVNARKRDKPLPEIKIEDPNDTVAVKRARNTAAARKSRAKKMEKIEDMAAEIRKLELEVERWKKIALERIGGHH